MCHKAVYQGTNDQCWRGIYECCPWGTYLYSHDTDVFIRFYKCISQFMQYADITETFVFFGFNKGKVRLAHCLFEEDGLRIS